MAPTILLDEFHLAVRAPRGLREPAYDTIRWTLDDRRFQATLRRAIRGVFRQYPALSKASARLPR